MNEEIKEILDKLQKVANRETASRNALMEMKDKDYQLLLYYITNLQRKLKEKDKENERLNNIIEELEKFMIEQINTEYAYKIEEFKDGVEIVLEKLKELKEGK